VNTVKKQHIAMSDSEKHTIRYVFDCLQLLPSLEKLLDDMLQNGRPTAKQSDDYDRLIAVGGCLEEMCFCAACVLSRAQDPDRQLPVYNAAWRIWSFITLP